MYGLIHVLVSPGCLETEFYSILFFKRLEILKGLLHLSLLALCVIHVNICEVNIL